MGGKSFGIHNLRPRALANPFSIAGTVVSFRKRTDPSASATLAPPGWNEKIP